MVLEELRETQKDGMWDPKAGAVVRKTFPGLGVLHPGRLRLSQLWLKFGPGTAIFGIPF